MKKKYNNYKSMYNSLRDESKPLEDVATKEEVKESPAQTEKFGEVDYCDAVNVRKEPDANAEVVTVFAKETKVKILDESHPYFYFVELHKDHGDIRGYINKNFIKLMEGY